MELVDVQPCRHSELNEHLPKSDLTVLQSIGSTTGLGDDRGIVTANGRTDPRRVGEMLYED